jgi:DNA-binding PadR family transcriptional regulator
MICMAIINSDGEQITLSRNDTKILIALLVGPMSGYEVASQCQQDEDSWARLSNGALRPALARLAGMSFIEVVPTNRSYKITSLGCQVLDWEVDRLGALVKLAKSRAKRL